MKMSTDDSGIKGKGKKKAKQCSAQKLLVLLQSK